jgi:hypothetical protein
MRLTYWIALLEAHMNYLTAVLFYVVLPWVALTAVLLAPIVSCKRAADERRAYSLREWLRRRR